MGQARKKRGDKQMKRAFVLFVFVLASCASVANYPITLSYPPAKQHDKATGSTIAVALLADKRGVADKRSIGIRDNETAFITLLDEPSAALAKAFAGYLENREHAVNKLDTVWDGTVQTLKPEWGNAVIGGVLEDFSINVKSSSLVKTEYICSVKLTLMFADALSKEIRHQERFEVSTSYVTVNFSREKAEELINSALSDTVERALSNVDRDFAKKQ